MTDHRDYLCAIHKLYDLAEIYPLSPCRSHCLTCKKKTRSWLYESESLF